MREFLRPRNSLRAKLIRISRMISPKRSGPPSSKLRCRHLLTRDSNISSNQFSQQSVPSTFWTQISMKMSPENYLETRPISCSRLISLLTIASSTLTPSVRIIAARPPKNCSLILSRIRSKMREIIWPSLIKWRKTVLSNLFPRPVQHQALTRIHRSTSRHSDSCTLLCPASWPSTTSLLIPSSYPNKSRRSKVLILIKAVSATRSN